VTTWVDHTAIKVIHEEARRLFGPKVPIVALEEPGLVYRVQMNRPRPDPRKRNEIEDRVQTHPTAILTTLPCAVRGRRAQRDEPIDVKSTEGRDLVATGRIEPQDKAVPEAWNTAVLESGLRTQNYDKGFARFIRKFNPDVPMSAVMAIEDGKHSEFGTAILFTQENRRCLLLDTLHDISEDDALWRLMLSWA
jgi:hypothetical protein